MAERWSAAGHGWWLLVPLGCLHANFILDTAITVGFFGSDHKPLIRAN
jgi:hypothetical protein